MSNKTKQTAVAAMATVLSVTTFASPLPVMAQEGINTSPVVTQKGNGQLETIPDIILPENLQATAGVALQEIELPKNWTWADESSATTGETAEYPARYTVDDVTYDYSEVEGYHAEGHYVERMVAVTVEPAKKVAEKPVQGELHMQGGNMPTTYNAGDILFNEDNFPDAAFRKRLQVWGYGLDGKITQEEIVNIDKINLDGYSDIKDLTGIEYFTALTYLNCPRTGITSLDVSNNTALTYLNCSDTGITNLDVSQNTVLEDLDCSITRITNLDVSQNTALKNLYFAGTGITSLDVSDNTALEWLDCSNTGITTLDVSQNTALGILYCSNTGITSLDLSQNTALGILNCFNTGLTNLDVSNNTALGWLVCSNNTGITNLDFSQNTDLFALDCSNTGITTLDVSQNTELTQLDCYSTPLAYLNVGTNSNIFRTSTSDLKPAIIELTEDSFNMTDKFTGIDTSKISSVSGADYNSTTGVMSNYKAGRPITYTYDCGTSKGGKKEEISVTLNLIKSESTISITENLNKTYDGNAVSTSPTVHKTGSTGDVSYTWEKKKNDTEWGAIASTPTNAGTYRVTAKVASDSNYKEATDAKEFTILQAEPGYTVPRGLEATYGQTLADVTLPKGFTWTDDTQLVGNVGTNTVTAVFTPDDTINYWTAENISVLLTVKKADNAQTGTLSLEGWTYGNTPATASVDFRFGTPRFLYANRAQGTYTETVPTSAGTWYVKAVVSATDNYEGAESEPVAFVIAPKNTMADNQIIVPDITEDMNLDELVIKDGDKVFVQGTDYDVKKTDDGKKVSVTITFKGNYTGTLTKTYIIEDKASFGGDKDNKETGKKDDAVQTGDTTSVGLWSALLAFSAGVAGFLKRKKCKEETKNRYQRK